MFIFIAYLLGKTQDAAKEEYVALINSLVAKYP